MAISVGAGDYGEYLPFTPPPGGGPVLLYISDGVWRGLLASDEITWEDRGFLTPPGDIGANGFATDTDNITVIELDQQSVDSDSTEWITTDGAFTWIDDLDVGSLPGLLNILIFLFRDGFYRILVFGNTYADGVGGEYSSPDGKAPWTKTGRVNSKDFEVTTWPADLWCATEDHAYYIMREDDSFTGLWRSIYVDTEVGSAPTVYRLAYPQPADSPPFEPPTGGTFLIYIDDGTITPPTTNPIAWNASAATILTELQGLPEFGAGGSASGSFATHIEITDPNNSFEPQLQLDTSGLTSAGPDTPSIFSEIQSIGQMGVGTFVTDPSVGSPVYQFNKMWGSVTGDVALVQLEEAGARKLWKLVNTATPADVSPGFLGTNDSIDRLRSPDSITWIGTHTDSGTFEDQLIRSDDSGDTWASVFGPVDGGRIDDFQFDPVVADKWYMTVWDAGFTVLQLMVSTDGGATWANHPTADTLEFGGKIVPLGGRFN